MSIEIIRKFDENLDSWAIHIVGELDIYTSPKFKEVLTEALEEKMSNIIINGESLSYIDSTGLGVLISALKKVKENNKTITIKSIKPNIKKLFDLTSLDKVFLIKE
ncbi:STAS domain-containing protein [Proteiniborus sp.]|uniref:STAS domain-containing protein n=1 Tax=Proteiniborus sp. TaxID=2079015 RepID=UPI0033174610